MVVIRAEATFHIILSHRIFLVLRLLKNHLLRPPLFAASSFLLTLISCWKSSSCWGALIGDSSAFLPSGRDAHSHAVQSR